MNQHTYANSALEGNSEPLLAVASQPVFFPLSYTAYRQLPIEIRLHYKTHQLPLCLVGKHQIDSIRSNQKADCWVKRGRQWQLETLYSSRITSECLVLIPINAVQVQEEPNDNQLSLKQDSFPFIGGSNYPATLTPSSFIPNEPVLKPRPQLFIDVAAEYVLKKGEKQVKPTIKAYLWQKSDTPEKVAIKTRGHQDASNLFEFDTAYSERNLPQPGDTVKLQQGWLVNIKGRAQYTPSVTLSWQGPVTGQHTFNFDSFDGGDDGSVKENGEASEWELALELPAGSYSLTARVADVEVTEEIRVKEVKTLQFGLFFDGTGKNYNADKHCETDEYEPSNIAKLYECYKQDISQGIGRHYIDGIGTVDVENEVKICQDVSPGWKEKFAQAVGAGFEARIDQAYARISQFLQESSSPELNGLVVDLFGYSRGAANARAFINDFVLKKKNGKLPAIIQSLDSIKFRFLGLYETVGSIGIPGDENNCPYNLNLKFNSAKHIYHLCALHEQRAYFPLSSIKSKPGSVTPHNFKEEYMPGAHADIGGGQALANHPKTITLSKFVVSHLLGNAKSEARAKKKLTQKIAKVKSKYAVWGGEFNVQKKTQPNESGNAINTHVSVTLIRAIDPQLEHLALLKMYQASQQQYLPLHGLNVLDLHRLRYQFSPEVKQHAQQAMQGNLPSMNWLKKNCIEISHQPKAPKGDVLHVDKPEKHAKFTTPLGIREMFFNHGNKAL